MIRFEEPEIKVVKFATPDVITTSGGYGDSYTEQGVVDFGYNAVIGGEDGDIPL